MKLAIMQPYLFPYLGYFQLIGAVDAFVVYDDVNFIKGGWINRNFIIDQGGNQLLTLPLEGASPNKLINQISVSRKRDKLTTTIRQRYGKAPCFASVYPLIEDILNQKQTNLACFLDYQLRRICKFLDIGTKWLVSSDLNKNNDLRGQEKILAICERLGASHYVNLPGGRTLYDQSVFLERGKKLSFIQSKAITYYQFGNDFVPNLSIIDVLMFNNKEQCAKLLKEYEFV